MNKKNILFVLGDIPSKITNGQILYQYLIIKNIAQKHNCYVFGYYENNTFLDTLDDLEDKIFKLKKNRLTTTIFKAIMSLTPFVSQKFNNKKNIEIIQDAVEKFNINVVHSIYFPATSILSNRLKFSNKIMTMPDLYSKYYKQLFFSRKNNIKFLYNFISYKLLEKKFRKEFQSVQFVNYLEVKESKFHNAVYIPLLFDDKQTIKNPKKIQKILLARANSENSIWFLTNIVSKLKHYEFIIISNDKDVENLVKNNEFKNIEIVSWVDNYDNFVNQFYLQISIDNIATGLSTKVIHAFKNENLIIGTELSYRGLPNLPSELKVVFKSETSLIELIELYMHLDDLNYLNKIKRAKEYCLENFDNAKTVSMINDSYSISDEVLK